MELLLTYHQLSKCDGICFSDGLCISLFQHLEYHISMNHIRLIWTFTTDHTNTSEKLNLQCHHEHKNTTTMIQGNRHEFLFCKIYIETKRFVRILDTWCEQPWRLFYQKIPRTSQGNVTNIFTLYGHRTGFYNCVLNRVNLQQSTR